MKSIKIEKTKISPFVLLELNKEFIIEGDSRPEDVREFYTPIIDWFKELKDSKTDESYSMTFNLEYLNSSSVIFISKILKVIAEIKANNVKFNIKWKHLEYDEDMIDLGEEFNEIYEGLNLEIEVI